MTEKQSESIKKWLEKVILHRDELTEFITNYHPKNLKPHSPKEKLSSEITAPDAERACEVLRNIIRKETVFICPEVLFNISIEKKDYHSIYNLLEETWIGVPESTSCWNIVGFGVAVDLLDDSPELDENINENN